MDTLTSTTTAKGLVINVGDIVKVRGSRVERRVHEIAAEGTATVWGIRTNGGKAPHVAWMNKDRLVMVCRAGQVAS